MLKFVFPAERFVLLSLGYVIRLMRKRQKGQRKFSEMFRISILMVTCTITDDVLHKPDLCKPHPTPLPSS